MAWISKYNHVIVGCYCMYNSIQHNQTAIEVVARISNYIPQKIMHLITYPNLHPKCSLSTLVKGAREISEMVLPLGGVIHCFYIWHCVPNILLWSILCKTVGLPSSTGESERTARRQFHSPTLRCFRGRLCEVAAGRGPLKQSRWPESNWTLPLRSVGVAPSLGRFWLVFTAFKLRYVLKRHIILSDPDGNQGVLDCFTVYPGLGGSAK